MRFTAQSQIPVNGPGTSGRIVKRDPPLGPPGVGGRRPPVFDEKSPPRGNPGRANQSQHCTPFIARPRNPDKPCGDGPIKATFQKNCLDCGAHFASTLRHVRHCHACRVAGIYRFICPGGRSYVGGTDYLNVRAEGGLNRSNARIKGAAAKYPLKTWRFEVLEVLPPNASWEDSLAAEQRHIDRLGTSDPKRGFNVDAPELTLRRWNCSKQISAVWRDCRAGLFDDNEARRWITIIAIAAGWQLPRSWFRELSRQGAPYER
jgi:hypothetical protein